ncbi:MAG: hypothetical protein L0I24_20730 [Pseudonocardia sp.]|nr:hypothetical protein [Pseudonocardia sp.]MDN5933457.1 hypothetical protein [Pseudonocardia sp.]
MGAELTLPPVLYWSASLARHLNRTAGPDAQHGIIDATVATLLMSWNADGNAWAILPELPADAMRLVAEVTTVRVRLAELERRALDAEACNRHWNTAFGPLCPCSTDPDSAAFGPQQECPIDGDGTTFVTEVHELRQIEDRARRTLDKAGPGELDQAAATVLRYVLTGDAS